MRIRSARVRGRLLRVDLNDGQTLTVRLRDGNEALQAAESMMETWDIDPLVESSAGIEASSEEDEVDCMTELAEHYMTSPSFRRLVHEMHDNFDAILADAQ
ncbi:hypothetical protein JM18_001070 [Phytophthora kernoviae]|uniref:Uncharacterized protein n=1 Tax=Phytophthora kernoviae TaxID=325452 RepID=A0A921VD96_9STRA|nr:hypothetical protein JM18_001070 [Phytophthora kernoviae]